MHQTPRASVSVTRLRPAEGGVLYSNHFLLTSIMSVPSTLRRITLQHGHRYCLEKSTTINELIKLPDYA